MRTVRRGGRYHRVADPRWRDPLDGSYAARRGGRWNPADSCPVLYLCWTLEVARANVNRLLAAEPYGPEDLRPAATPILVDLDLAEAERLDVVTHAGCEALGLPPTYPLDERGEPIDHGRCQPLGQAAWDAGLAGVAAPSAWTEGEELAHFLRDDRDRPREAGRRSFAEWFWPRPGGGGRQAALPRPMAWTARC